MPLPKFALFAIIFTATSACSSTQWQGIVTRVTDGDTLWVRPGGTTSNGTLASREPRKIRIAGIDAPESCQRYGRQSTAALKAFIARQTVTVTTRRTDDYGREVAKMTYDDMDVGAWMVSHGHAWSYHYRHNSGPYAMQEETAQLARRGLFADASPTQPRVFRRAHGPCHTRHN